MVPSDTWSPFRPGATASRRGWRFEGEPVSGAHWVGSVQGLFDGRNPLVVFEQVGQVYSILLSPARLSIRPRHEFQQGESLG